jgi:lipopolysaccharide/colanic/teichoic acid biosynthesis glycosyltransferase
VATDTSWWARGGKRTFDIVGASVLGLLLLPAAAVCAFLVRAFDGAPVLFRQARIGQYGRPFEILKFRTMTPGNGSLVTSAGDPRITPLGGRLRRAKLDELPQLWNVLRGDMSLVGPRPEVAAHVALEPHSYRAIADLRPGMTDWASLIFLDEESILQRHRDAPAFYERRLAPRKLALARLYHRRVSCRTDLLVLAATACLAPGMRRLLAPTLGRRFVANARAGF